MEPKIGITPEHRDQVARALNSLLADESVLYVKTRNAHWNVEGADFHAMHLYFESQYGQLEEIIDNVAERIRALGHYAVATMHGYLQLTSLSEQSREENSAMGFITELLADHETIIMHLRGRISQVANEWNDIGTSDFLTSLLETHEKMAWMLRAHL